MRYWLLKTFLYICFLIFCRAKYIGRENIPSKGRVIVASNHLSNFDPPAIGSGVPRTIRYLAKEELFHGLISPFVKALLAYPVKRGTGDTAAIKKTLTYLKNNDAVGIFPEGTRSPDGELHKLEDGAAMFSVLSGAPIIPAAIVGTRNLIARKFPLKLNRVLVKYGKPIFPDQFEGTKKEKIQNITQRLFDEITQLKKELDEIWEP